MKKYSNKTDGISDGTLTDMQMVTTFGMGREFDHLQRLVERSFPGGLAEKYNYASGEGENTTTTQVAAKMIMFGETQISFLKYRYDGNGNIQSVLDQQTGKTVTYTYDELNQLTGVVHPDGRTENYIYDAHGNLRLFNNGYTTHTYTYGNSDWKDLLTAVDGVALTYDEIGNPLTYYNGQSYSLSWTEGRKLATITTDGKTTNYLYDADGNRIKKTNSDGSYILYVIANGTAIGEKHYSAQDELTKTLRYIYDENGSVCGYVENSADGGGTYYFIKNLQGDVTHVYRMGDNAIVAAYSYDSWGNIISATGEKAQENPFRYRGYYYDVESGFYATGSRYYDPEIGRFISADTTDILGVSSNLYDKNLYAYCDNNPVVRIDTEGTYWTIAAGAVIGAVINAGIELGMQLVAGGEIDLLNIGLAALGGAASGALASTGLGYIGQAIGNAAISGVSETVSQIRNGNSDIANIALNAGKKALVGAASTIIGGKGIKAKGTAYSNSLNNLNSVKSNVSKAISNPKGYRHQINKAIKTHQITTKAAVKSTTKDFTLASIFTNAVSKIMDFFGW